MLLFILDLKVTYIKKYSLKHQSVLDCACVFVDAGSAYKAHAGIELSILL
jgi:hypothetical protein